MRKNQKTLPLVNLLLLSVFILSIFQTFNSVYAQGNGESLTQLISFRMLETGDSYEEEFNVNSLELSFPSDSWNLTSLNMNLTDITFDREIIEVENEAVGTKHLYRNFPGLAVQINISEATEIHAVYIYGFEAVPATSINVSVQINGYNSLLDEPNATVYGTEELNMSISLGWYVQTFSAPILLNEGNYTLVLNGTDMIQQDGASYYWNNNEIDPSNPNLFSWEYKGGAWETGITGETFLYKLDQRIISDFYPENHNMTAKIGGNYYSISNGPGSGTGSLNFSATLSPNETQLSIPIINNRSSVIFNLTYHFSLSNYFFSDGLLTIMELVDNEWKLSPNIQRFCDNHSVKFAYPLQWENLIVKRNNIDMNSSVIIDTINKIIIFPNITIINGASWEIIANSPIVEIVLNIPKVSFQPGQELLFSVLPPISPGNLTYNLINSLGFKEHNETIEITQITNDEIVFSYTLSSNPNEGIYKAYIYWHDNENAGIVTQEFQVNIPFVLDPIYIVIIVVGSALIATASFTSYKLIKRSRRIHGEFRQKIYNKYMDVLNLDYFIVIEKRTGLNIYEQILASKNIDASLITGFLEAIRSFGIELTGANEKSQTIKLEYQQSKIIMAEFKNFRILLIMKENPSQDFLDSINALSYDIDTEYGEQIANFVGDITKFGNIKDLLDKHLETSLIYPLKLGAQNIKLNSDEKSLINIAQTMMKKRNTDYFFVANLLSTKKGFQVKDAETILNLIEKKIFQPKI